MNLNNYYWYFTKVLSDKFCNDVIKTGLSQNKKLALTGKYSTTKKNKNKLSKEEVNDLKKVRDSNVSWLDDLWIYKEIQPYIHIANRNSGWNFEWDYSESCQFTIYNKKQHYDWHCDSWDHPYNNPENKNTHGKIRKLSVSISLTDPKDYEGGELEFDFKNNVENKDTIKVCKEIQPKGSIVVFPSFVWHRVKPVTKGTRHSLVIWNLGYPFK